LPIALPLTAHRVVERGARDGKVLLAVGNAAVILAPNHITTFYFVWDQELENFVLRQVETTEVADEDD